jgi:GAF domain-containing protein
MNAEEKQQQYDNTLQRITELTEGETDLIAVMATVACELYNRFNNFHWTGFYRVVEPELLKVGPYQGEHGCLQIPFDKGVCGAAARLQQTQLIPNVREFPGYIACSPATRSENFQATSHARPRRDPKLSCPSWITKGTSLPYSILTRIR